MLDLTASSCPRCGAALSSSDSSAALCLACLLLTALPQADSGRDPVSTLAPGTEVGPFRIVRLLGRGGMATVYEAVEGQLDRSVALKVLPPEFLHEQTFGRRFEQEARVVAKLEHQHIVPIFAAGIDDGIPWMSTRLMAGGNLAARLARRAIEPAEGLRVLRHIGEALDYAHARGVVHRDVKPANILLDAEGQVYLADFGLALMLESGTRLSHGVLTGTPHYMSPEQALGQLADHRSDIYSLAIVAYEMFTGTVPFQAESPIGVLMKHVNDPLPLPAGDPLPSGVFRLLRQATAKMPDARCATAGAFVSELERAFPVPAGGSETRASRWVAGAVGAVATAALLAVLAFEMPGAPESTAEPAKPDNGGSTGGSPAVPAENGSKKVNGPQVVQNNRKQDPLRTPPPPPKPAGPDTEREPEPPGADSSARGTTTGPVVEPTPKAEEFAQSGPAAVNTPQPQEDTVVKAKLEQRVAPTYPVAYQAAGITGQVVVDAMVRPDGSVTNVVIVRSNEPRLNEYARAAVMKYRYTPQSRNGTPEQSTERVTVWFTLK